MSPEKEEELRRQLLQKRTLPHKVIGKLERPKERTFTISFKTPDDRNLGSYTFHHLTHGEHMTLTQLPFYDKIHSQELLTDEEMQRFDSFKAELVEQACEDKTRWKTLASQDSKYIDIAYLNLMMQSGISRSFQEELNEFIDTDFGFLYGYVWFYVMGKTPSEIAKLPPSDYLAVSEWITRYKERLK